MTVEHHFEPADFDLDAPICEISLKDEEDTRRLGQALAKSLAKGDFLGLVGNLGAGKTTLVQGLVATLQSNSPDDEVVVHSPTYTLINHYPTSPPVHHLDLYRLERYDDLESIGYWDVVDAGRSIVCVEWFSIIQESWPEEGVVVELVRDDSQGRMARIWAEGEQVCKRLEGLVDKMQEG